MAAIKLTDISGGAVVLIKEPLEGFTPAHIRSLVSRGLPDNKLAAVFARVYNQCGWVGHSIGAPENDEEADRLAVEIHTAWWSLEKELVSEMKKRIAENEHIYGKFCNTEGAGYYRMVRPFMERNGYRDGGGWWIKKTSGSRKLY